MARRRLDPSQTFPPHLADFDPEEWPGPNVEQKAYAWSRAREEYVDAHPEVFADAVYGLTIRRAARREVNYGIPRPYTKREQHRMLAAKPRRSGNHRAPSL